MPAERDTITVTYRSGTWVAMAGSGGWALLDVEPSDPVVASLWTLLRADDSGSGLDSLTAAVARDVRRGFGLVTKAGLGVSVVLAGDVTAVLGSSDDGPVSGEPVSERRPSTADDDPTASPAPRRSATGPTGGGSPVRLRCPPAVRWAAFALAHTPEDLQLCISEEAGQLELPLTAGVVPASGLSIRWTTTAPGRGAVTAARDPSGPDATGASSSKPVVEPTPDAAPAASTPGERDPVASVVEQPNAGDTPVAPTAGSGQATAAATGGNAGPETDAGPEILDERAGDGGHAMPPLVAGAGDVGPVTSYDYLFGDTVMRTVEDAAVRTLESDATLGGAAIVSLPASATGAVQQPLVEGRVDVAPAGDEPPDDRSTVVGGPGTSPTPEPTHSLPGSPPPATTPRGVPPVPATPLLAASAPFGPPLAVPPPQPAAHPRQVGASGMIESVPWATARPQTTLDQTTLDATGTASEPDLELTVTRAPRMTNAPAVASRPPILGPTVQAVHCLHAHPNPVQQERCRVCGAEIEDRTPVTIPRPVLGVLRLPGGDPIVLDRSAIIGREPKPGRLVDGETAHAVKVASPEGEISRTHLEVRLEGWHVLVTDLNSTNGTTIARPGASAERLRPNEPTLVEPGTSLTLADQFTIVFEGAS